VQRLSYSLADTFSRVSAHTQRKHKRPDLQCGIGREKMLHQPESQLVQPRLNGVGQKCCIH
jgi:hypothetical protein